MDVEAVIDAFEDIVVPPAVASAQGEGWEVAFYTVRRTGDPNASAIQHHTMTVSPAGGISDEVIDPIAEAIPVWPIL